MLSVEDNEYLTGTGPGTPMGTFMRRFWMPFMLSDEIAEPDCPPVRVRLLGEASHRARRRRFLRCGGRPAWRGQWRL